MMYIRGLGEEYEYLMTNQRTWWPVRGLDDQWEDMMANQRTCRPMRGLDKFFKHSWFDRNIDLRSWNILVFVLCQFWSNQLIILTFFVCWNCLRQPWLVTLCEHITWLHFDLISRVVYVCLSPDLLTCMTYVYCMKTSLDCILGNTYKIINERGFCLLYP